MALSEQLLKILACPETKQPLSLVDDATVAAINLKIRRGELTNRKGGLITEEVSGALLREDRNFAYPIRADIPVMLIEESFRI